MDCTETCAVCMAHPPCRRFEPCGHACCCDKCATALLQRKDKCPVCRGAMLRAGARGVDEPPWPVGVPALNLRVETSVSAFGRVFAGAFEDVPKGAAGAVLAVLAQRVVGQVAAEEAALWWTVVQAVPVMWRHPEGAVVQAALLWVNTLLRSTLLCHPPTGAVKAMAPCLTAAWGVHGADVDVMRGVVRCCRLLASWHSTNGSEAVCAFGPMVTLALREFLHDVCVVRNALGFWLAVDSGKLHVVPVALAALEQHVGDDRATHRAVVLLCSALSKDVPVGVVLDGALPRLMRAVSRAPKHMRLVLTLAYDWMRQRPVDQPCPQGVVRSLPFVTQLCLQPALSPFDVQGCFEVVRKAVVAGARVDVLALAASMHGRYPATTLVLVADCVQVASLGDAAAVVDLVRGCLQPMSVTTTAETLLNAAMVCLRMVAQYPGGVPLVADKDLLYLVRRYMDATGAFPPETAAFLTAAQVWSADFMTAVVASLFGLGLTAAVACVEMHVQWLATVLQQRPADDMTAEGARATAQALGAALKNKGAMRVCATAVSTLQCLTGLVGRAAEMVPVTDVLEIMEHHDTAPVVEAGLQCLAAAAKGMSRTQLLLVGKALPHMRALLSHHSDNPLVAGAVATCLCFARAPPADIAGFWDGMRRALAVFGVGHASVAASAMRVLEKIIAQHPVRDWSRSWRPVLEATAKCLCAHVAVHSATTAALTLASRVLGEQVCEVPCTDILFVQLVEGLEAAMRAHGAACAVVAQDVLLCLGNMALSQAEVARLVAVAIPAAVTALTAHAGNTDTVDQAVYCCRRMLQITDDGEPFPAPLLALIAEATRRNIHNSDVAAHGLACLVFGWTPEDTLNLQGLLRECVEVHGSDAVVVTRVGRLLAAAPALVVAACLDVLQGLASRFDPAKEGSLSLALSLLDAAGTVSGHDAAVVGVTCTILQRAPGNTSVMHKALGVFASRWASAVNAVGPVAAALRCKEVVGVADIRALVRDYLRAVTPLLPRGAVTAAAVGAATRCLRATRGGSLSLTQGLEVLAGLVRHDGAACRPDTDDLADVDVAGAVAAAAVVAQGANNVAAQALCSCILEVLLAEASGCMDLMEAARPRKMARTAPEE
jgi:hypothetical protein